MITMEIKNGIVYIAEENTSGCKYPYKTKEDIISAISTYINNYINL